MNYPKSKYKIFRDSKNNIIAVSTYAGKNVKGVAKCDPRDTFNEDYGTDLAIARCAAKIADKRVKRATKERAKALKEMEKIMIKIQKMNAYVADAEAEALAAKEKLSDLIK